MSDNEDGWTTVTGRKRAPAEQRLVDDVESETRFPKKEEVMKQKRVDPASIAELVKARLAAGQTQEMADAACAMPKNTIKKIEAGQLVPLGGYLRAISRTLKVNLRFI